MKARKYTIVVTRDLEDPRGVYNATVPAIRGCHTWGFTRAEAFKNAREAIQCCLDAMIANHERLPEQAGTKDVEIKIA
ncbi:MAG TPA: type II toxin-antitoxin system HicB family antitoxin [Planctomycetota bacterium]|jgi:predicted RNase H-like HicB family nuclease